MLFFHFNFDVSVYDKKIPAYNLDLLKAIYAGILCDGSL